jgi:hypothetical protein
VSEEKVVDDDEDNTAPVDDEDDGDTSTSDVTVDSDSDWVSADEATSACANDDGVSTTEPTDDMCGEF